MKKMTKEEIIRFVVLGIEMQNRRREMQRIARGVCMILKIEPHQDGLAECISGESRISNDEAVTRWLLRHYGDASEINQISEQDCAAKLQNHLLECIAPCDTGDLYV